MAVEQNGDAPGWDPAVEPLMITVLGDKGIQCKQASEVGKRKVMYFRGKDFLKFALGSGEVLKKKCPSALEAVLEGNVPSTEEEALKLGNILIHHKFCYRADFAPINEKAATDKKLKKWPDRLARTWKQTFESDGFYIVSYEPNNSTQLMYLTLVIVGVLLAVMFPAWPRWGKIGLWYLLIILPSLWIMLILSRVALFVLLYIIGLEFWILPNFLESNTFSGMFRPLFSLYRLHPDNKIPVIWRIVIFIVVQWLYQQSKQHSITEIVVSSYTFVLNWGVEKLTEQAVVSS